MVGGGAGLAKKVRAQTEEVKEAGSRWQKFPSFWSVSGKRRPKRMGFRVTMSDEGYKKKTKTKKYFREGEGKVASSDPQTDRQTKEGRKERS